MRYDDELSTRLIQAGPAAEKETPALVKAFGIERIARFLVEEAIFRCAAPINARPVNIALHIGHGSQQWQGVLRFQRDRPVRLVQDDGEVTHMRLDIGVAAMLRRLFGRTDSPRTGDFGNEFLPSSAASMSDLAPASQATDLFLSACSPQPPDLGSLAVQYGSDKWASFHWYTPHYERHFRPLRDDAVNILEIGIGGNEHSIGGASLKMWKRYFHRGTVTGIDIYDKSALNSSRLTTKVCDQNSTDQLIEIAESHGPFDIVIDDGSHVGEHVHTSFWALFPYLSNGGIYVIEDLGTSYIPDFGGSPDGRAGPHTAVGLVKDLADDLHYQEHDGAFSLEPKPTQGTVTGLHLYHNIVFIAKGHNGEEGFPDWLRALFAGTHG